jgi:hypothetical protein
MHPESGMALTDDMRRQEMELAVAVGARYVRLAHYTHDRVMGTIADRCTCSRSYSPPPAVLYTDVPPCAVGLLTGVEAASWQTNQTTFEDPLWQGAALVGLQEAVNDTFNRPSAILYHFLNEGNSNLPENCAVYRLFAEAYRRLSVQVFA